MRANCTIKQFILKAKAMTVAAKKNLKSGRKKVQLPFLIFTVYLAG